MKTGIAFVVLTGGALLAFALRPAGHTVNWHVVGWVLMVLGAVGLVVSPQGRVRSWVTGKKKVRRVYHRPGQPPVVVEVAADDDDEEE